jgi:hypothetical protein
LTLPAGWLTFATMRKKIIFIYLLFLVLSSGCATMKQPPNVWLMTPQERINYYEMQIKNYQELIAQEETKIKKSPSDEL